MVEGVGPNRRPREKQSACTNSPPPTPLTRNYPGISLPSRSTMAGWVCAGVLRWGAWLLAGSALAFCGACVFVCLCKRGWLECLLLDLHFVAIGEEGEGGGASACKQFETTPKKVP